MSDSLCSTCTMIEDDKYFMRMFNGLMSNFISCLMKLMDYIPYIDYKYLSDYGNFVFLVTNINHKIINWTGLVCLYTDLAWIHITKIKTNGPQPHMCDNELFFLIFCITSYNIYHACLIGPFYHNIYFCVQFVKTWHHLCIIIVKSICYANVEQTITIHCVFIVLGVIWNNMTKI